MKREIIPNGDNIIIQREAVKEDNVSDKGIILSVSNDSEPSSLGVVKYVGEGRITSSGEVIPLTVKEGDKVIFNLFAGTDVEIDGEDYTIIKNNDVLAILR